MNILGLIFCLLGNIRWHEALAVSSGEDHRSTPEGCSLSCLVFPNTFPRKNLYVHTTLSHDTFVSKPILIIIPNLGWTRLNFFEVFGYCFLVREALSVVELRSCECYR